MMEIRYFMEKINLAEECINYVLSIYKRIKSDNEFKSILIGLENHMLIGEVESKIIQYSQIKNLNTFEVCLVILCASGYIFKSRYEEKGIDDRIFWASMQDIRYKVNECKKCYGVWGISCFRWYDGYYEAARFELGRLQYERWKFEQDIYSNGSTSIKKGDFIVNTHIPSSGPLIPGKVIESLELAYDFMKYKFDGKMFIMCKSWLLYPSYKPLFKPDSNIRKFIDLFDIFDTVKDDTFAFGCANVFNTTDEKNIDLLPQNTTLQRNFAEYMRSNNPDYGRGYGMIVMENGKIISK